MKKTTKNQISAALALLATLSLIISACSTPPATAAPTEDVSMVKTQSAQTVVADLTKNAPPPATATATEAFIGPTPNPSVPVPVVPTADPNGPSAAAKSNTSIYSGPGTKYVLYGTFLGGQTAVVLGKSEDDQWWAISVPVAPTGAGWVSTGSVDVQNADNVPVLPTPPVPETTKMEPPGPTDPQVTALANTDVRSGPATNYPAYGIAQAGDTGRVIGRSEDGQWWVIRLKSQECKYRIRMDKWPVCPGQQYHRYPNHPKPGDCRQCSSRTACIQIQRSFCDDHGLCECPQRSRHKLPGSCRGPTRNDR